MRSLWIVSLGLMFTFACSSKTPEAPSEGKKAGVEQGGSAIAEAAGEQAPAPEADEEADEEEVIGDDDGPVYEDDEEVIGDDDGPVYEDDVVQEGCPRKVHEGDFEGGDVNDLRGVTEITGDLLLNRVGGLTELTDQLSCLERVGGQVAIESNPRLTRIDGMKHLKSIGQRLYIYENPNLVEIGAFPALERCGSDLVIIDNRRLERIGPFDKLVEVNARMAISGSGAITSLGHFPRLTKVNMLSIQDNRRLPGITDSFPALTAIGHDMFAGLYVTNNASLTHLNGFASVSAVSGSLHIERNRALDDIGGLKSLNAVKGQLYITRNPKLCQDYAQRVVDGLGTKPESAEVKANKRRCD